MNWEQHTVFPASFNELICTTCSPNRACGKLVNNSNQPVKSSDSRFAPVNYSPLFQVKKSAVNKFRWLSFGKILFDRKNNL